MRNGILGTCSLLAVIHVEVQSLAFARLFRWMCCNQDHPLFPLTLSSSTGCWQRAGFSCHAQSQSLQGIRHCQSISLGCQFQIQIIILAGGASDSPLGLHGRVMGKFTESQKSYHISYNQELIHSHFNLPFPKCFPVSSSNQLIIIFALKRCFTFPSVLSPPPFSSAQQFSPSYLKVAFHWKKNLLNKDLAKTSHLKAECQMANLVL